MKEPIIHLILVIAYFITISVLLLNLTDEPKDSVPQTSTPEVNTEIVEPSFIEVYTITSDAVRICVKIYNEVNVSTSGTVDWETAYNALVRKAVQKVFSKYQLEDLIKNSSSITQEIRMEIGYNLEPYFADIIYEIHNIELVIPEF